MNSAMRLMVLSVAAGALASAAALPAPARQTRRGNSAEVERLERERREREMNERDLRERQLTLRNLGVKAGRMPAERPEPRIAVAQIREDFARLQVVNNDLARATSRGGEIDLKFVAKSASEIRKLAGRLLDNLALPEPGDDSEGPAAKAAQETGQLRPSLSALDGLVLNFAERLSSWGVSQVDARSAARARRELEQIIVLSGWVKKTSERLAKATRQPPRTP